MLIPPMAVKDTRQQARAMPTGRYIVTLTPDDRTLLDAVIRVGKRSGRTITRTRVLLLTDQAVGGPEREDRQVTAYGFVEVSPDSRRLSSPVAAACSARYFCFGTA
jgi:hypothetical protein